MTSGVLANLDKARQLLAESRTLSDVKKVRDIAQAAKLYAKAAHLGGESQNFAAEIFLLASRKAGEILSQLERGHAGRPEKIRPSVSPISQYAQTLKETDTSRSTAKRWQQLAAIPQALFDKTIRETVGDGKELTAAGVLKATRAPRSKPELDIFAEAEKVLTPLESTGADGQLKLAELLEALPKAESRLWFYARSLEEWSNISLMRPMPSKQPSISKQLRG